MIQSVRQAFGLIDISNKPWIVVFILTSICASLIDASGLILVFAFFQVALNPRNFSESWVINLTWKTLGSPDPDIFFALLGAFVVLAFLLRTILLLSIHWVGLIFRQRLQRRLMNQLFRLYLRRSLSWHLSAGIPRIVNGLRLHVPTVCLHIVVGSLEILANAITLCVLLMTMLWLRPLESVSIMLIISLFSIIYFYVVRSKIQNWADLESRRSEETWSAVSDPLNGIRITKIHGLEGFFANRLDAANNALLDISNKKSLLKTAPPHLLQAILVTGMILFIVYGFWRGVDIAAVIPTLILFFGAAFRIIPVTISMLNGAQSIRAAETGLQQIREDYLSALGETQQNANDSSVLEFKSIHLKQVEFSYGGSRSNPPAIKSIDFSLYPGEQIALVGPSGAGKSTLAELIMGLLQPTSGQILINGLDTPNSISDLFAYVPQDTVIVSDTFERNIALGDAPIDEKRLEAALSGAVLQKVVARLANGAKTLLAENRAGLSGGERQRIGIARALYRDAPIIVMDEPTSALDALTEADISATLAALKGKRTVILIAHRLSTVRHFDRIAYMERGRILQQGSFDEIYAAQPQFRAMVDLLMTATGRNAG